jgi:hypothetical protein
MPRPIEPTSPEAAVLKNLGEHFKAKVDTIFSSYESARHALREFASGAREFALSLNQYWVHARETANDGYIYSRRAEKQWLDSSNTALQEIDRNLQAQLKALGGSNEPLLRYL